MILSEPGSHFSDHALNPADCGSTNGRQNQAARFDLAGADCGKISRLLINAATEYAGAGIEPVACLRDLRTETGTGIAFGV